jgi:hypothetical protein
MYTSNLDDNQKEYIKLYPEQVLAQKRMMGGYMEGMGSMGGLRDDGNMP